MNHLIIHRVPKEKFEKLALASDNKPQKLDTGGCYISIQLPDLLLEIFQDHEEEDN